MSNRIRRATSIRLYRRYFTLIEPPAPPPTGASQEMHDESDPLHIFGSKLSMNVLDMHDARGPLHIFRRKLTMTVLDMHEVIGRFQKVRQN